MRFTCWRAGGAALFLWTAVLAAPAHAHNQDDDLGRQKVLLAQIRAQLKRAHTLWVRTMDRRPPPSQIDIKIAPPPIWTCPMHTQVRQDRPGNCPVCEMTLQRISNPEGATTQPATTESFALGDLSAAP